MSSAVVTVSGTATGTDAEWAKFSDSNDPTNTHANLLIKNECAKHFKLVIDLAMVASTSFIAKYS